MDENKGIRLIREFMNAKRSLENTASLGSLTKGEYMVLRRIKVEREGNRGKFKALTISEYLSMPPPAVSRIFNTLEDQGLIERKINTENRRSVIIELTQKGESALLKAEESMGIFADGLIIELGDKKADSLIESLEKITDYCNKVKMYGNDK